MTAEHKAALAEGRAESRAVKKYLEALEQNRPKRGRRRTKASIEKRLAQIDSDMDSASPLKRVSLIQERMDLSAELQAGEKVVDLSAYEKDFLAAVKDYSARKKISYAAWRELGVPADVLKRAGMTRGS